MSDRMASSRNLSFSQRKGYTPRPSIIQRDGMSDDLRNSLWNVLDKFWTDLPGVPLRLRESGIEQFVTSLWMWYFKKPLDELDPSNFGTPHWKTARSIVRSYFFASPWHAIYDLLEFTLNYFRDSDLPQLVNAVLEHELSGYRFVGTVFTDITNENEIDEVQRALSDNDFPAVRNHLAQALRLLSDRENPDYRNSIKESISAVESMAQVVAGRPGATLGAALISIEKADPKKLHPALKTAFDKLYGYTSDGDGIRHAMLEEPNLAAADARYFLIVCSAFTNYLKSKL